MKAPAAPETGLCVCLPGSIPGRQTSFKAASLHSFFGLVEKSGLLWVLAAQMNTVAFHRSNHGGGGRNGGGATPARQAQGVLHRSSCWCFATWAFNPELKRTSVAVLPAFHACDSNLAAEVVRGRAEKVPAAGQRDGYHEAWPRIVNITGVARVQKVPPSGFLLIRRAVAKQAPRPVAIVGRTLRGHGCTSAAMGEHLGGHGRRMERPA